jgi:hypothetical protein
MGRHDEEGIPMQRTQLAALVTVLLAGVLSSTDTIGQTRGEEWEYAMATEMGGMKLQLPPSKICVRPDEGITPAVDNNCHLKDVKVNGATTNFRIVCSPPDPGEGTGRFTRKGDRVEGRYTMKNSDGEMVVIANGRKLGSCEPAKMMSPAGTK